jgi:esterase/lipase superfamily enzyme
MWSWHSPAVGRTLSVARWGHYGKPVLFFPTGGGGYRDCERFLMVRALSPLIEAGRIKLYAVDSVCRWSWANWDVPPPQKARTQALYDEYLVRELLPFIRSDCGLGKKLRPSPRYADRQKTEKR